MSTGPTTALLQGTLDLLILRALSLREMHGLAVARRVEQITGGTFRVKPGSLFPALHRLEEAGWLASSWGTSDNNRRAKFYRLTKTGGASSSAKWASGKRSRSRSRRLCTRLEFATTHTASRRGELFKVTRRRAHMQIGILGTGVVGQTIGGGLTKLGHDVMLGSRSATNEKAAKWVGESGPHARQGTFADAAAFGEIVFNCTAGDVSLAALQAAGTANLDGKTLVDVSNPLDFSQGFPPTLSVCNTDSVAERIQLAFPNVKVVKALNTMTAALMVNPSLVAGEHDVFLSGNDAGAKARVAELLRSFGWRNIIDLGDITTARGPEMVLPLWLRLMGALKTPVMNFHIAH